MGHAVLANVTVMRTGQGHIVNSFLVVVLVAVEMACASMAHVVATLAGLPQTAA